MNECKQQAPSALYKKKNPCHNASDGVCRHPKQGTEKSGHGGRKTHRTGGRWFEGVQFSKVLERSG